MFAVQWRLIFVIALTAGICSSYQLKHPKCKIPKQFHFTQEIQMVANRNIIEGGDTSHVETVAESFVGEPEGYLSSDLNSLGDTKKSRVIFYIALALAPCLFLVPFFLSRDFVPPTDSSPF